MLTVFFDNVFIGSVDERFSTTSARTYTFDFDTANAGTHTVSFRLDAFTPSNSSVRITNVHTGLSIFIPEPRSHVLVLTVACVTTIVGGAHRRLLKRTPN